MSGVNALSASLSKKAALLSAVALFLLNPFTRVRAGDLQGRRRSESPAA